MKQRLGQCSSCGAQYRVPESFRADRARCKSCGGVVELRPGDGAVQATALQPAGQRMQSAETPPPAAPPPHVEGTNAASSGDPGRAAARAAAGRVRARRHRKVKPKGAGPLIAGILVTVAAVAISLWLLTLELGLPAAVAGSDAAHVAPSAPPAPPPQPAQVAPPAPKVPAAKKEIDLAQYADEQKLPGTSDEDWTRIQGWVTSFLDPGSGGFGKSARSELVERGREAFPALLNAMKGLELASDAGHHAGDLAQGLLTEICRGQTHGWYSTTQAEDVRNNKIVIVSWIRSWRQARETPEAWASLTQSTLEDSRELFERTGPFPASAKDPVQAKKPGDP